MELILKMKNRYYKNILKLDIIKKIIKINQIKDLFILNTNIN